MKNPLTEEHRKMLELADQRLNEARVILGKLEACGENCGPAREIEQQLSEKVQAYRQNFFGADSWN